MTDNRQLLLRERPTGEVRDDCFELVASPLPVPGDGEVLLRNRWLGFDPAQRGWLNDIRSYVPPVAIGDPMRAYGIGEVVTSMVDGVEPGDLFHAQIGWQDYASDRAGDGRHLRGRAGRRRAPGVDARRARAERA